MKDGLTMMLVSQSIGMHYKRIGLQSETRVLSCQGVINNPVTDLIIHQKGKDERMYRLGRVDDVDSWKIPGVSLGQGSIRIKVTDTITKTMQATQVGKITIGDLYFAMLNHPAGRGPGFLVIPPGASVGRVQLGAIELTRAVVDKQPEPIKDKITEAVIKTSLIWMHDCIYYLTTSYEWEPGKIDKEGFIPIQFVEYLLQVMLGQSVC